VLPLSGTVITSCTRIIATLRFDQGKARSVITAVHSVPNDIEVHDG